MSEYLQPTADTYSPPLHGWTCFHCGETFCGRTLQDQRMAREHFGTTPASEPACILKLTSEDRSLLRRLRALEDEVGRLRREAEDEYSSRFYARLASEIKHTAPAFRDCRTLRDMFNVYDSMEGRAITADEKLARFSAALTKCSHPDRPGEICRYSDESDDQCVHCEERISTRIAAAIHRSREGEVTPAPQKKWLNLNINSYVRVKLSKLGHDELRRQHRELYSHIGGLDEPYTGPIADLEGWTTFPLWSLMNQLGHLCALGFDPPFETTIEIDTERLL